MVQFEQIGQFSTESLIGTFENVDEINFRVDGSQTTLYRLPLDTAHFVLEESGYFKAPSTGLFEFELTDVDDGALVTIGGAAYDCCTGILSPGSAEPFIFGVKAANDDSNPVFKSWVYLEKGLVYPFKLVYLNAISAGSITLNVKTPEGVVADVDDYIYQVTDNASECTPTVVSTVYSTSTVFTFSNNYNQVDHSSSIITSNGFTYIVDVVTYGYVTTYYTTIRYDGTTTSYSTGTFYTSGDYATVYKSILVYAPNFTTYTFYNQPPGYYTTTTDTTKNVVTIYAPKMSTFVTVGPTPTTTFTTFIKDGQLTTEAHVVATTLRTSFAYPNPPMEGTITTAINGDWRVYVYYYAARTTYTTDVKQSDYYFSTETLTVDGQVTTKLWIRFRKPLPITYVTTFYNGNVPSTSASTTVGNQPLGYWSNVVYLPSYTTTVVVVGNYENTVTITNEETTYVQVQVTSYATITTWATERARSTGFIPVTSGGTTSWVYAYVYPFSYDPEHYGTTILKIIQRPPMETLTTFWTGTIPTTSFQTTVYDGNDNIPVTDTVAIVYNILPSVEFTDCAGSTHTIKCSASTTVATVGGQVDTITSTLCYWPNYLVGSFQQSIVTSTIYHGEEFSQYIVTNVNNPIITCSTTTVVTDCDGETKYATCTYGSSDAAVGTITAVVVTTSCALPVTIDGSFVESTTISIVTINEETILVPVVNAVIPAVTCETRDTSVYVSDCSNSLKTISCAVATTQVVIGDAELTTIPAWTTSCAVPSDLPAIISESLSTTTVTINNVEQPITLTNTNSISVTCTAVTTNATHIAWTTSCVPPDDISGTFETVTVVSTLSDLVTSFTISHVNSPHVECAPSTVTSVVSGCFRSIIANCEVATTVVNVDEAAKAMFWTTSCTSVDEVSFVESSVPKVFESGDVIVTVTVTNVNLPISSCSSAVSSSPVSSVVSSSSSSVVLSSSVPPVLPASPVPSAPPVSSVPLVSSASASSVLPDSSVLTSESSDLVHSSLPPTSPYSTSPSLSSTTDLQTISSTTTVSNTICEYFTTTISTLVNKIPFEIIAIAVPPSTCYAHTITTTIVNSVCSLETQTTTTTIIDTAGLPVIIHSEIIITPPESCNIYYTWEPAIDCIEERITSFIGTTNEFGAYVNATLVVIETTDTVCGNVQTTVKPSDPFSEITIPSSDIPITTTSATLVDTTSSATVTTNSSITNLFETSEEQTATSPASTDSIVVTDITGSTPGETTGETIGKTKNAGPTTWPSADPTTSSNTVPTTPATGETTGKTTTSGQTGHFTSETTEATTGPTTSLKAEVSLSSSSPVTSC
ncbi:hypothetical protein CANINC_000107 [Pichia inconspicua]|uniref:PA14 domain-containing protein n=1 Tax=Pichia inconspicua TaxID=52247 RepID=A0A4T0X776_9ASCO|nr:hypothetical protein CANINC_000107 [[Candida] inconspicua]